MRKGGQWGTCSQHSKLMCTLLKLCKNASRSCVLCATHGSGARKKTRARKDSRSYRGEELVTFFHFPPLFL
jgi:hypothetical protein